MNKENKNCYGPECEALNCFECENNTSNHSEKCHCETCNDRVDCLGEHEEIIKNFFPK